MCCLPSYPLRFTNVPTTTWARYLFNKTEIPLHFTLNFITMLIYFLHIYCYIRIGTGDRDWEIQLSSYLCFNWIILPFNLANYFQIVEQRLITEERNSGYIYCKIYYGIWVPDFTLDGQKAILCNTILRRWCWFGFCLRIKNRC